MLLIFKIHIFVIYSGKKYCKLWQLLFDSDSLQTYQNQINIELWIEYKI